MTSTPRSLNHPALLAATAVIFAVLACSPLAPAATPTPEPTPTPSALPGLAGSGAIITVSNSSARSVCYLQISPSASDAWGEDWLGDTATLDSGTSLAFQIAPGTYDIRAQDCDRALIAERRNVAISTAGLTWEIPFVPDTVTLINNSHVEVCYVRMSPSSWAVWGSDWMGSSETLPPGSARSFAVPPGQEYDLQALDCDEKVLDEQQNIFIPNEGITWTLSTSQ